MILPISSSRAVSDPSFARTFGVYAIRSSIAPSFALDGVLDCGLVNDREVEGGE
jgi:hypothetical protein